MEWQDDWISSHFGRQDTGRRVEIDLGDGKLIHGELFISDWVPDLEGDEYPVYSVFDDDGRDHEIVWPEKWRFID